MEFVRNCSDSRVVIGCTRYSTKMRFVVTLFLALIVLTALQPWLEKLGIGRLPGDLRFRIGKREVLLPFASTLLLTVLVFLIGRLI